MLGILFSNKATVTLRDGEMAQWFNNMGCSCRGPRSSSFIPMFCLSTIIILVPGEPFIIPVPGYPMLLGTRHLHGAHTYIQAKHSYSQSKINLKRKWPQFRKVTHVTISVHVLSFHLLHVTVSWLQPF
jgi:hypothetical protein